MGSDLTRAIAGTVVLALLGAALMAAALGASGIGRQSAVNPAGAAPQLRSLAQAAGGGKPECTDRAGEDRRCV